MAQENVNVEIANFSGLYQALTPYTSVEDNLDKIKNRIKNNQTNDSEIKQCFVPVFELLTKIRHTSLNHRNPPLHLLYHKLRPPVHRSSFVGVVVAYGFGFAVALIGETLRLDAMIYQVFHDFKRTLGR